MPTTIVPSNIENPLALFPIGLSNIYIFSGSYANDPDTNGFYWGFDTSAANPAYNLGCTNDISIAPEFEDISVVCDNLGTVREYRRLKSLKLNFTLKSLFPLSHLKNILDTGSYAFDNTDKTEWLGWGVPQGTLWKVLLYHSDLGNEFGIYFHRCSITYGNLAFPSNDGWNIALTINVLADPSKPAGQRFGTIVRVWS